MRITTRLVLSMETGEILCHDWHEYAGTVELCRGEDRPAADLAQNLALQQQQQNQKLLAQQQGVAGQIQSLVIPEYQKMLNNPATATAEGQQAASAYGSAQDALASRAARTGNSAGTLEAEDKLARDKATTLSDITMKNRNTAVSGLEGTLSNLYGTDANLYARALGIPVEYLNTSVQAAAPKGQQPGINWSWQNGLGVTL